jgi:colanic acid/amylovoran biosynthesis glycosyltransferase
MLTIAYLANEYPSPVEPYVREEIDELRSRGVRIIAGSVRKLQGERNFLAANSAEFVVQSLSLKLIVHALWLCIRRWMRIWILMKRIVFGGNESVLRRMKAAVHTFLGACYAVRLENSGIDHIHVHHGYYGSWIAMTAALLKDVRFSMTLHGSDLLLHGTYLDLKLERCAFCVTVSEYNRQFILTHYPTVDPQKLVVARLGVELPERVIPQTELPRRSVGSLTLLAVGRLHPVKDHAFLIEACRQLQSFDVSFECMIAGEGPERRHLEVLVRKYGLEDRVMLLGHVRREQMGSLYDRADLVVLTSRSEGIPLVLMEAMARGKIVLAPAITGIPELVIAGKSGFLYRAGSLDDLVDRLIFIQLLMKSSAAAEPRAFKKSSSVARTLDWVRHAARVQVLHNFNRQKNLKLFGDLFLRRIKPQSENAPDENLVLQQIQLSLQRNRSLPV